MSNFDSEGPSENEWDDRGELAWNEFDWELYLRDQDDVIHRYLAFYEKLKDQSDRIDQVARLMGWDDEDWSIESLDGLGDESSDADDGDDAIDQLNDGDPYTLHKNPIFVATKAIFLSLRRTWELLATEPTRVPQELALTYYAALCRAEEQATLAVQALDFGDYAMAISLFKRALRDLNGCLSLLGSKPAETSKTIIAYREDAFRRLFDLREIWLRVMNECRTELERPAEDDDQA